jgi:hypothetical protein
MILLHNLSHKKCLYLSPNPPFSKEGTVQATILLSTKTMQSYTMRGELKDGTLKISSFVNSTSLLTPLQ